MTIKKRMLLPLAFVAMTTPTFAAESDHQWMIDQSHTRLGFAVNHMGYSTSHGIFTQYEGTILYDREKPSESKITIEIATDSVKTLSTELDHHLQSDDFFNSAAYSTMRFESTHFELNAQNHGEIKGELTLLGKRQPVTLTLTLLKDEVSPMTEKETIGFHASATIKRSDWGMETMIPAVSDEVLIEIDGELMAIDE